MACSTRKRFDPGSGERAGCGQGTSVIPIAVMAEGILVHTKQVTKPIPKYVELPAPKGQEVGLELKTGHTNLHGFRKRELAANTGN